MQKRSVLISNIKISYIIANELTTKGTIFFIHGNSLSADSWAWQFKSELLKHYRLIAFDLPAHGDSGVSLNTAEDYSIPGLGLIMANSIKALAGNNPYIIVGLSLGSNILAEALAFDLTPQGIVLAGSCIIGGKYTIDKMIKPNTSVFVVFTEQAAEADVDKYASEAMLTTNKNDRKCFIDSYYKVKPLFRYVLAESIQQQKYSDQVELLKTTDKPVLMIFGKDEKIVDPDYLNDAPLHFWNDQIYKIPGASHLVNIDQPESFNKLLADFSKDLLL